MEAEAAIVREDEVGYQEVEEKGGEWWDEDCLF